MQVATYSGFASEYFSEHDILSEIAASTGIRGAARQKQYLIALTAGLGELLESYPSGAAIRGFGHWQSVNAKQGLFRLTYNLPLAPYFGPQADIQSEADFVV
ncbi:MAG: hypothetical protein R2762_12525 [Bryobacteraceae bacterium]